MSDCQRDKVLVARRRVIEELTLFRIDDSDERLSSLMAAIENWHHQVRLWSAVSGIAPRKHGFI